MPGWTPPQANKSSAGGSDQQQQQLHWATAPNAQIDWTAPALPASWSPRVSQQQPVAAAQLPVPLPAATRSSRMSFSKAKVAPEPGHTDVLSNPLLSAPTGEASRQQRKVPLICCVLPLFCCGLACVTYDASAEEADEKLPPDNSQPGPAVAGRLTQHSPPHHQSAGSALGEQTQQSPAQAPALPPRHSTLPALHQQPQQRLPSHAGGHIVSQEQPGTPSSPASNDLQPTHCVADSLELPQRAAMPPPMSPPASFQPAPSRLPPIGSLPPVSIKG